MYVNEVCHLSILIYFLEFQLYTETTTRKNTLHDPPENESVNLVAALFIYHACRGQRKQEIMTVKAFRMKKNQINAVLLNFLFAQKTSHNFSKKKNIKQHNCLRYWHWFNIDNTINVSWEWFLKDHVTLKTKSNDTLKLQLCHDRNKLR